MLEIFYYDKTLKRGEAKDLARLKNKLVWVDATNITREETDLVKDVFSLHPLTAEDLLLSNVRIKVEEFSNYLFCVFYGMQKTKLIELDLVLGKNFVVSSHRKEIPSFSDLKGNKLFLEKLFRKGPDFMLHRLVDMEVDNYFPEIDEISTQIDNLEEEAVEKSSPDVLRKILKMRQTVTRIRKISMAQREKMSFLAKKDYKLITDKSIPYFRDVYDHSIIVLDSLDDCRSTIANLFDIYMSSVNNKMSEVMKVLSVIATIALPLTALSSIYGTNFRVLPGAEFAYGFWVMILVMVLMCLSMLYYFRRKGWF